MTSPVEQYEADVPRCPACDRPLPEHQRQEYWDHLVTSVDDDHPDESRAWRANLVSELWSGDEKAGSFPAWWALEDA